MSKITRDSFNVDIRNKVGAVLTSGTTFFPDTTADRYQYGYGTALIQTVAVAQQRIDDSEWDNIRLDLIKARTHQKGVTWVSQNLGLQNDIPGGANNVFDVAAGEDITSTIYNKYKTVADDCVSDRFLIGPGQSEALTPPALSAEEQGLTFSVSASWFFKVQFSSAAVANQFFNSGGAYQINLDAIHGPANLTGERRRQSEAMIAAIGKLGTFTFGATQFYAVQSTTFKVLKEERESGAYNANEAQIRCRVDNAAAGSASSFDLGFRLTSDYTTLGLSGSGAGAVNYGDQISLELTANVTRIRANGVVVGPLPSTEIYNDWSGS